MALARFRDKFIIMLGVLVLAGAIPTDLFAWKSRSLKKVQEVHYQIPFKPTWVSLVKKGQFFKYKRKEHAAPQIFQDKIFVGADSGWFYAIKKRNGHKLWRYQTVGAVNTTPAFWRDRVIIGDDKGKLYALSMAEGKLLWQVSFDAEIRAMPAVAEKSLYVMTQTGELIALAPETGEVQWRVAKSMRLPKMTVIGTASPYYDISEATPVLYVGYADGTLAKLKASDGTVLWEKKLQSDREIFFDVDMIPLIDGPRLYVATFGGYLYCLNKANGEGLWKVPVGSGVQFSLYEESSLIVSGSNGHLYSLHKMTGETQWELEKIPGGLTRPLVYKDMVVVGSSEGKIYFVQAERGEIMAGRFARKGLYGAPYLDENFLVYLSNGGRLYALRLIR